MRKLALLFVAQIAISASATAAARPQASPGRAPQKLQTGVLIPKVKCAAQPGQSYALYLPSNYNRSKKWPIVYAFDPAARGSVPVELMKEAGERYGYIVAGSNNATNGAWDPLAAAAQAMFQDTQSRLSIDARRVYLAGFSGTARFVSSLAQSCDCAAGVLMDGAGFAPSSRPAPNATFAVFLAVGTFDFNYGEVVNLDAKLAALHYVHALSRFDGPHDWAPAGVMDEALAWFRLMAMKDGREARDMNFVNAQAAEAAKRAEAFAQAGDAYASWEEYRKDAETFDGLADVAQFRRRAAALEKEKAVREGAEREEQEFDEQARLMEEVTPALAALRQDAPGESKSRSEAERQIARLFSRAEHEKNLRELRVERRALSGISVQALETGIALYQAKDVARACTYFQLAAEADPDSPFPKRAVAVACPAAAKHSP